MPARTPRMSLMPQEAGDGTLRAALQEATSSIEPSKGIEMKIIATAMLAAMLAALAGCNTVAGAGKDTQAAGSAVERAAEKAKPRLGRAAKQGPRRTRCRRATRRSIASGRSRRPRHRPTSGSVTSPPKRAMFSARRGRSAIACLFVLAWALLGSVLRLFRRGWQLVINTSTTIGTFLMVFLLQNTQNRDTKAINIKLDELLRAIEGRAHGTGRHRRPDRRRGGSPGARARRSRPQDGRRHLDRCSEASGR